MELDRPSAFDLACHFQVSRIPGACITGSRLSNLLEKMYKGHTVSPASLSYLHQLGLIDLHQLAVGDISYQTFLAMQDDPVLVIQEQAAKAAYQAEQAERREKAAHRVAEITARRGAKRPVMRELPPQNPPDLEVTRLERIRQEARWASQRQKNRELAEARYTARLNETGSSPPTAWEIAQHFRMHQIPAALVRPLSNILDALYTGRELAPAYLEYLSLKGFADLRRVAVGEITYDSYILALEEAESKRNARAREEKERERLRAAAAAAATAARIERERDPAFMLRKKYGIREVAAPLLQRLMTILTNVDKGARLLDEDLLWLSTDGNPYYSEKLKQTHHLREATFHADEYRRTGDPWKVINASGHFRKAEAPDEALMLISNVPENSLKDAKARSAMFTTHGGVMRDLNRHDEGMELGLQAHALQPENFRPCTLLGALHMEMGDYDKAQDWYSKAEARGASKRGIDNELKAIFLRANALKREEIRKHLLARDPERHSWINQQKAPKRKRKP